jgi:hypothetical protein
MSYPRVALGFLIMAAGILITLDNLGMLDAGDYMRYWPAALVAIGAVKVAERGFFGPGAFGGWIWVFAGGALLLWTLDYVNPLGLLPLILVVIGGRLVWNTLMPPPAKAPRGGGYVDGWAVLGGSSRSSGSQDFRGGDLNVFMGGIELDLRQAAIAGSPAVIDVFVMWGGIEIKVPERWAVDAQVTALLGGFEDKTRPGDDAQEKLTIRGLVLMGGIEIRN